MSYAVLEALEAQIADLDVLIASIDEWDRPTRCIPMTLWDLVMHMSSNFAPPMLGGGEGGSPTATAADWFRYDIAMVSGVVASRMGELRADEGSADPAERWRAFSQDFLRFFRTNSPCALVPHWNGGWMSVADFGAARGLVELGVHALDIAEALGREQRMHPLAEPIVCDVFDSLLGQALPSRIGWDATTYAFTASGRRRLTAAEALDLRSLASSFPLFA